MKNDDKLKRLVLLRNLLWALAPLLAAAVIVTGWQAFRPAQKSPEEIFRQEEVSEMPELDQLPAGDGQEEPEEPAPETEAMGGGPARQAPPVRTGAPEA